MCKQETEKEDASPLLAKARAVARAVQGHGGRALLVGGYVRDELLGLAPKDADLEVYGVEAGDLRGLLQRLGRVDCVGESFRVYKLVWHQRNTPGRVSQRYELDVSLPRRDKKVGAGHRGFEVEGDPHATIEEAARRRDFTVNAILRDPLTGEIIDPFGGRADLGHRILRAVDAAHFAEDSLRVLRAVQFAARYEMSIEPGTVELCRSIPLNDLPKERIWGEWEKLLLKAEGPSLGLKAAHELGVLAKLFPPLQRAMERDGEALCGAVDAAAAEKQALTYERQVTLMLAVIGAVLGQKGTAQLLDTLGVRTLARYDVREQVRALVNDCTTPARFHERQAEVSDGDLRRVACRCEPQLLALLARALGQSEAAAWFIARMRALGVADGQPEPLLMGRHLLEMGLAPGPQMGVVTRAVYELQLDGEVQNLDGAREAARRLLTERDTSI